jgi:hypothetical protein
LDDANFQFDPMANIIHGVESAQKRATYLHVLALEVDEWFPFNPAIDSTFKSAWKTQVQLLSKM